jgi:hypothetical protein
MRNEKVSMQGSPNVLSTSLGQQDTPGPVCLRTHSFADHESIHGGSSTLADKSHLAVCQESVLIDPTVSLPLERPLENVVTLVMQCEMSLIHRSMTTRRLTQNRAQVEERTTRLDRMQVGLLHTLEVLRALRLTEEVWASMHCFEMPPTGSSRSTAAPYQEGFGQIGHPLLLHPGQVSAQHRRGASAANDLVYALHSFRQSGRITNVSHHILHHCRQLFQGSLVAAPDQCL